MTSFPTFTLLFVQKYSRVCNKKKITRRLEDMNSVYFHVVKNKILLTRCARSCNILYLCAEVKLWRIKNEEFLTLPLDTPLVLRV